AAPPLQPLHLFAVAHQRRSHRRVQVGCLPELLPRVPDRAAQRLDGLAVQVALDLGLDLLQPVRAAGHRLTKVGDLLPAGDDRLSVPFEVVDQAAAGGPDGRQQEPPVWAAAGWSAGSPSSVRAVWLFLSPTPSSTTSTCSRISLNPSLGCSRSRSQRSSKLSV